MTTTASKQGLRAAATERRNRHAQRRPLPPKGGVELVELPEYAEEYGRMTQPQLRKALKERFGTQSANDCPKGKLLEALLKREREQRAMVTETHEDRIRAGQQRKRERRELEDAQEAASGWGKAPESSKSWPKAEACIAIALKNGWDATPELLEGDVCELTLRRGDETLWISWTGGVLTTTPMPTYTIADRVVKLRNASAVKQYAERAPEAGASELQKVASNTFFKRKPSEPKRGKLPFNPETATEAEIIESLMGRSIAWHNRLREIDETAVVGLNPRKIYFTEFAGERIVNFICPQTGYRAFRVSGLTRVGRKSDSVSVERTKAVQVSTKVRVSSGG